MDSVKNAATQSWNGMKDRVTGGIAAAKEKFRTAHYALEPVRWIWTRVWNHTDVLAFVLMIFYLALQQDVEEISWTMGDRYVCRDYRECYRKTISDEFMIDVSSQLG